MKRIILLLFVALMLPVVAQAQSNPTVPNIDIKFAYDARMFGWEPFGGYDNWRWMKRAVFADVQFGGYIDTMLTEDISLGGELVAVYYGKPIPMYRGQELGDIQFGMYDSATVTTEYRRIAKAANQWFATAWEDWGGGGIISTTHNSLGAGNPDTLIVSVGVPAGIDWTNLQYIQFKYTVTLNKVLRGDGSKRTMEKPIGNSQPFLRGQVLQTIIRGDW